MRLRAMLAAALLALPAAAPAQAGATEIAEAAFARVGCAVPRDRFEDFLALVAHDGLAADGLGADPQVMRRAVEDLRSAVPDTRAAGGLFAAEAVRAAVGILVALSEEGRIVEIGDTLTLTPCTPGGTLLALGPFALPD